jgi:hypothetical protein
MVLTTEQRVELLFRAREAKKAKKLASQQNEEQPIVNVEPTVEQPPTPKVKSNRKKNEIAPLPVPVQVIQENESDTSEEEVIEVPIPKKKTLPKKWLKKTEPQKMYDEKVSKEEYVIDDDKPQKVDNIVIPAGKEIKKGRVPRASAPTRTLTLTEPKAIEEVFEEVKNNDMKYRPKQVKASAPIQIKHFDKPLKLFNY